MDLYRSLDVTEKILSVLLAVSGLLTFGFGLRKVFARSRPSTPNTSTTTVIFMLSSLLLAIALSGFAGYSLGKNTSLQNIQAIREVIDGEGQVIIRKNLDLLDTIYAPDAIIVHCPAPGEDPDVVHEGRAEIQQRYLKFFSSEWRSLSQVDLSITVENNTATAVSRGIVVNTERFDKFDTKFTLKLDNGRWVITRFECELKLD